MSPPTAGAAAPPTAGAAAPPASGPPASAPPAGADPAGRPDPRAGGLFETVDAAAHVPRRIQIVAPGGYGKSGLVRELTARYRRAGVAVIDAWAAPALPLAGPIVVIADDAHLLGEARLRELLRLLSARPAGLILAYRPWPDPAGLAELRQAAGPPLRLSPFTRSQTADQLGGHADPELVGFVHDQTGGVPRLIDRLGPALAWPSREIPDAVLAQFQSDLDGLDDGLRRLLLAAATDVELTRELLAALVDRDPPAAEELLAAARATGLLGPDGRLLPLARRAVALLTPASERSAGWRRLAELVLERGGPVLPLVRSLRELGVGGAGLAGIFETAADEALPEEPALAAELFAATAPGRPGGARRALAAALAGDLDLGLRLADPLITAAGAKDRAAGAAVAATALAHRGQLGRSAELYAWSATPTSVAFATVGFLGTGAPVDPEPAPPDGPPTLLTGAAELMARGIRESVAAPPDPALSTLVQAAALLEPAGRAVLLPDSPAALAALVAIHSGELDVAESVLRRATAVGLGSRLMARRHLLLRAWVELVRGRTGTAAELHRAAMVGPPPEPRDLLFATALAVGLARRASDLAGMLRAWGPAREALLRHPVDLFSLLPVGELAVAAARLGERAQLAPHLREADQLLERLDNPPLWAATVHWSGVHAAVLAEDPAAADGHLAALAATAGQFRHAGVLAAGARSWLAVLRGEVDPDAVEAAARGLHGDGLAWEAARLAGQAAIRTADRRAMTRLLDCARALQGRSAGAAGGDPGGVPAQPAGPVPGRLSGREQEVAALLLDGLTYKQIGDRLFISAKTVEHHVARMRQRLGCATRSDLLAQLRAGPQPS